MKKILTGRYGKAAILFVICFLAGGPFIFSQNLLFKTGFEKNSRVVDRNRNTPVNLSDGYTMAGNDSSSPKGNWDTSFKAGTRRLGNLTFNLDQKNNGAHVTIIDDPTGSNRGKVMRFWLQTPSDVKGRVQTEVYGQASEKSNEITSIVKIYLHPNLAVMSSYPNAITWFTLQELFTNPIWGASGINFRMGLGIYKKEGIGQKLYWALTGDLAEGKKYYKYETYHDDPAKGIWVNDIIGQWVTLVMYYKKGNASTGRLKWKIIKSNGQVQELFNITNWTYHPDPQPAEVNQNTGLTDHNPHKMYAGKAIFDFIRQNTEGGKGAAIIYWDDWEYYEGNAYDKADPPSATVANLALKKPVTYSGQDSDSTSAAMAVDGSTNTRWSISSFPQWLQVDLGAVYNINKTELVAWQDRAYQFKIETSTAANGVYTTVVNRSGNTTPGTITAPVKDSFAFKPARYIRLTVTGASGYTGKWVSLLEFRVFGKPTPVTAAISEQQSVAAASRVATGMLYPNPVQSVLFVAANDAIKEPVHINIYDLQGRLLYNTAQPVQLPFSLPMNGFAPGSYLVKLYGKGVIYGTEKVVKQ